MGLSGYLCLILWATLTMLTMIQYAPMCKELPKGDQFMVFLILLTGGPVFALANVLEAILDCYLPEGWDQQNGF